MFKTINHVRATTNPGAGIPIPLFATRSRATQQYQTLARELYAYVEKQTLPEIGLRNCSRAPNRFRPSR